VPQIEGHPRQQHQINVVQRNMHPVERLRSQRFKVFVQHAPGVEPNRTDVEPMWNQSKLSVSN
jgi:hypothetical protein